MPERLFCLLYTPYTPTPETEADQQRRASLRGCRTDASPDSQYGRRVRASGPETETVTA